MAVRSYCPDTDFGYACTVTLTLEIWPLVKAMSHPWVMDNWVKYYPDQTSGYKVMAWIRCEQMTLGEGHDWPFGHGQPFCEILSRSNMAVRSYCLDTNFVYVYKVTLTIWPWVKVMTHPWVIDNNCVKYPAPTWQWGVIAGTRILVHFDLHNDLGSRSWHTLGS